MRYTFFEVENFKGIKKLRVDLSKKPHSPIYTLVGLNESGKTTILEAISFFSYGAEALEPLELSGHRIADVHDLIPIAERANFNGDIVIRVGVELEDLDIQAIKQELFEDFEFKALKPKRDMQITEIYSFENSRYKPNTATHLWNINVRGKGPEEVALRDIEDDSEEWTTLVGCLRKRMPRIWYFPNFYFDFPDRIYLEDRESHDAKTKEVNKFYRGVLQGVLDSLDNGTTVATHIRARAKSGDSRDGKSLDDLLLNMGRRITDDIFAAWNQMFHRTVADKQVVLDIGQEEDGIWYVRFRIQDADGHFQISERSLGFRWFFVYLLVTLYRDPQHGGAGNTLYLFDEPASNLHSTAQVHLLRSFDTLIQTGCSIIYTTHSHHLINVKWLEATYVVSNLGLAYDGDGVDYHARQTDITVELYRKYASDHPGHKGYFQPILDVLDYRPSQLEDVPAVVMVEGKNDYYVLSYALKYLLQSSYSLSLLPGMGASGLDTVISLYVGWAREFIVLLDSDAEGEKQKNRYANKFGAILDGRLFLISGAGESLKGKCMEDLFETNELLAIQQIAYRDATSFNKTQFYRSIQEAYMRGHTITISENTRERFEVLAKYMKSKLAHAMER